MPLLGTVLGRALGTDLGTSLGAAIELPALTLSNLGIIQNSRNGDLVAVVLGKASGATLSIVGGTGVVAIDGDRLEATASTLSVGALSVTIRQAKSGFPNRDQTFNMTVYAARTGLALDPAQLGSVSFEDLFTSYPDLYNPTTNTGGTYATFYNFGADGTEAGQWANPSSRTLSYANGSANAEGQTYIDPVFTPGSDPFAVIPGGGLIITASPTPAGKLTEYGSRPVVSGLLRTRSFSATYGYHEVRFLTELKPGIWPAAWMYEAVAATGAELDTHESGGIFGQTDGSKIFQFTHSQEGGEPAGATTVTPKPDLAFRTVGVLWKNEAIAYYIDGIQSVAPFPRPASMNQAMRMLLNLAVGWFGDSPAGAYDPAQLPYRYYVDRHRFYAIAGGAPSLLDAVPGNVTFPLSFTGGSLPTGVGFVRYSAHRAFSAAGAQTVFDGGAPAMTDIGLVVEPSGTNLYASSENLAGFIKTNTTVTADATAAPDGTTTADAIVENGANGVHIVRAFPGLSASTQYTLSFLSKRGAGSRNLRVSVESGDITFNLGAGTVSQTAAGTATITARGSWYLCTVTFTTAASPTGLMDFYMASGTDNSAGSVIYTGDGTSSLYITQIQIEAASRASAYMGASGTRSGCSVAFNIPGGITTLTYTFDDNSTQNVSVSSGAYYVPTTLNRRQIKSVAAS